MGSAPGRGGSDYARFLRDWPPKGGLFLPFIFVLRGKGANICETKIVHDHSFLAYLRGFLHITPMPIGSTYLRVKNPFWHARIILCEDTQTTAQSVTIHWTTFHAWNVQGKLPLRVARWLLRLAPSKLAEGLKPYDKAVAEAVAKRDAFIKNHEESRKYIESLVLAYDHNDYRVSFKTKVGRPKGSFGIFKKAKPVEPVKPVSLAPLRGAPIPQTNTPQISIEKEGVSEKAA